MKKDQDFISRLNATIEANFRRDNFGVQELAQKLSLSRSQLHRKITEVSGTSASAYISEFRLKKAMSLLQEGKMSASEVAYEVGYSSPSYFSTAFKKYFLISPTQVKISNFNSEFTHETVKEDGQKEADKSRWVNSTFGDNSEHKKRFIFLLSLIGIIIVAFLLLKASTSDYNEGSRKLVKDKSIAVLPFLNYSNDPSLEAFCDGMTDELISKLSTIKDFDRVISRTSTFKFKDIKMGIPQIASELGVAYILEGNMQKADGKIKVNIQLIDANADDHVWTDHYIGDWDSKDIFIIQDNITAFIAEAMQMALKLSQSGGISKNIIPNKQAYDLYLQAKYHMFSLDEGSMEHARQMLLKSIELDSTFANAYSELGLIWFTSGLVEGFNNQEIAWNRGKFYLDKARQLNPSLINNEFYLLQGYFYYEWDFEKLENFYNSRFSKYTYDRESSGLIDYAIKTGRFEKALEVIDKSIAVNPLDPSLFSFKSRALWFLGDKEQGISILEAMDELNKNDWFYLREAAQTYFIMQAYEHSRRVLNLVMDRFDDRSPMLTWLKLYFKHLDNDRDEVDALLDELQKEFSNGSSGSPAWFIALYYLVIELDKNKTFEWLERSYDRKEVELTWFKQEPMLEPIRNDDRYWVLYRKIGFDRLAPN